MKLTIKKEYKDLIPPLTENEFKQLEENCMHNGIRDAICVIPDLDPPSNYCKYCYEETEMIFEDDLWMCKKCHHFPYQQEFIIVDGHNRFKIAQDNKLDFDVYCLEDIEYDDQYAIKDWIINNQLGRRNLTDNQKKQLRGLKYNNEKAKHGGTGANQYQQSGQNDHSAKTHDRLAEELGVSSRTIQRDGEWVKGLEHIDEELKQDILQQKIKVRASDIQEIAKAEPMFIAHSKDDIIKKAREIQKEKKAEKINELEKRKAENIIQAKQSIKKQPEITISDVITFLNTFDDNSIDLLLTDPPYSTDIDDIYEFTKSWLYLALEKVKKDGRVYICAGAYPIEIKAFVDILLNQKKFIVDNPLIWTYRNTLGVTPKMKYNLNYQIIWHLYSDQSNELDISITNEMFNVQDINAPDGRQANRLHKWQKPDELARRLIRHSTMENDLVVDCFACTGTFLLEASRINRKALGCEIDINNAKIAEDRGCIILGK